MVAQKCGPKGDGVLPSAYRQISKMQAGKRQFTKYSRSAAPAMFFGCEKKAGIGPQFNSGSAAPVRGVGVSRVTNVRKACCGWEFGCAHSFREGCYESKESRRVERPGRNHSSRHV